MKVFAVGILCLGIGLLLGAMWGYLTARRDAENERFGRDIRERYP